MDKIVTDPEILKQVSRPTTLAEVDELNLVERLKAACKRGWVEGCGLAAIQIGVPVQFSWFVYKGQEYTLMNPRIVKTVGKPRLKREGCLSIPNKYLWVPRFLKIQYKNAGQVEGASDLKAQIVQHEIAHMAGILNIDVATKEG